MTFKRSKKTYRCSCLLPTVWIAQSGTSKSFTCSHMHRCSTYSKGFGLISHGFNLSLGEKSLMEALQPRTKNKRTEGRLTFGLCQKPLWHHRAKHNYSHFKGPSWGWICSLGFLAVHQRPCEDVRWQNGARYAVAVKWLARSRSSPPRLAKPTTESPEREAFDT